MGIKHGLPVHQGSLNHHSQDLLANQGIRSNHRARMPLKKPFWPAGSDAEHGISVNRECLTMLLKEGSRIIVWPHTVM